MDRKILLPALILVALAAGAIGFELIIADNQSENTGPEENVTVVAEDLDVPWDIEFLPDGDMLVTERPGTLLRVERENGSFQEEYSIEGVKHRGEGGLLGLALHPNYTENSQIYLYMTTERDGMLENRVVKYTLEGSELTDSEAIIGELPGAPYHDGGRIAFGPDGKLYITAGDATNPDWAQDTDRLAGKILRVNPDGSIPSDNPFNTNETHGVSGDAQTAKRFGVSVYSYGHRNPQGLTWVDGQLWATEHGDRQHDELNRIEKGGNYGWPVIEADQSREGMIQPEIYADGTTWAPAGATYTDGSIFFTGLRGNGLYEANIENGEVTELEKHLTDYGRLREVELGPQEDHLYVATSNTDGRGNPGENDDRILKIDARAIPQ